jgi:mannose-1-phosphate guanylyltransferase/mannose-1-phosphate guanylyltransferase/mannose-6-phosphate isomerase
MQALSLRTMREMNVSEELGLFEPYGKNTAPAIALMCHHLIQKGQQDEVVGVFPADHLVADQEAFEEIVKLGVQSAENGEIVTLGIQPRYAATGYGYIEVSEETLGESKHYKAHLVKGFREKPDVETARGFLNSGQHYWNSGMFLFKVSQMVEAFKKHLPEVWNKISTIKEDKSNAKYAYASVESISVDYGIMEKLDRLVCIPCNMGWSDVGSWDEISRLSEELPTLKSDSQAQVYPVDSHDNYVFSIRDKVIGLVGVDHLLVVETPDALLIAKKGQSQKVKNLVEEIKSTGSTVTQEHLFEMRPWGGFEVLADAKDFKAKSIKVDPDAQLSYQSHSQRSEHWIIIEGQAEVVLDGETRQYSAGDHVFIPKGAKHRMRNPGEIPLVFVEVQTGSYFGEDDIVRYEDDYDRV